MTIENHPIEQEEIMAYLDGELPPEQAAEAASHLERCAQCKQLVAELQEVSRTMASWHVEELDLEPSENITEAFRNLQTTKADGVGRTPWRKLSPRYWPKPVWGLAGAALPTLLIVGMIFSSRPYSPVDGGALWPKSKGLTPFYDGRGRLTSENRIQSPTNPPASAPMTRASAGMLGKLENDRSLNGQEPADQETSAIPGVNGPMIVRTAELQVVTREFDKARSSLEQILKRHHGYVGELNVTSQAGSARSLNGTLRVPASQLDATLAEIKNLGRTEKESQGGEEVTQQYVDLEARLANARHTEQRLTDILRERTGKLSDVLAVETQISRVRGEIEQMDAQRKAMKNQVDLAALTITLAEEYKAELKAVPPSTGTQFRNAAVEGYRSLVDGIIAVLLWLLSAGPTLLVWIAILFFPARMLWKRLRLRLTQKVSEA